MKCKKCGKENVLSTKLYAPIGTCECGYIFTMKDTPEGKAGIRQEKIEKQQAYQQRLDNILSKFLDDTEDTIYIDGKSYNVIKSFRKYNFIIFYTKENQFISCYHAEIELEYIGTHKLKTVEYLFADLETE